MTKKTSIWVWVLPLALLSMVFFYTSKVSPILPQMDGFESNQGVCFHGKITNAPKSRTNYDRYLETEIPIVNNSYPTSSNYSTVSYTQNQNSISQPHQLENSAIASNAISTVGQSEDFSNKSNSNLTSSFGLNGFSSGNSKNTILSQSSKTPGFSSLSEDFTTPGEISNRQSAGGVDPGSDPTDPALPLGDGFWILLLLAASYTVWKQKLTGSFL
jgi:hypothetical protein